MNKIRQIRKRIGITAGRLAKLIGTNVCSVYNWEQGKSKPRYPIIIERINALDELFGKLEKNPDYLLKR